MTIPVPDPIVPVRDVLPLLGFEPDPRGISDNPPALKLWRGGLEVTAGEMVNRYFQRCVSFGGLWRSEFSLKMIDFDMPLSVESCDQVVAWVGFGIGLDCPWVTKSPWFEHGRALQHLLPWERYYSELRASQAELQRLRDLRPHCYVPRQWMRVLLNHLAGVAGMNAGPLGFTAHFDGRMLTIDACGQIMGAPATGQSVWPEPVRVILATDASLPRRLTTDPVEVGVWEGTFEVERSRLSVIDHGR